MNIAEKPRMTVPEFLEWAVAQPKGRYELADGKVVTMSPEGARHVRAKAASWLALSNAIARAGLPCEAFTDGMTVRIDELTAREPDAAVQCAPVAADSLLLSEPVIVVEVLSPSSRNLDTAQKLEEYFSVRSIAHYLIVNPMKPSVTHHRRAGRGKIETRVMETGEITMMPPGITVTVAEMFGRAEA